MYKSATQLKHLPLVGSGLAKIANNEITQGMRYLKLTNAVLE